MRDYVIGVVGNPNCGKTTLFNAMTGTKQRVGNWPGVTVDRKSGEYTYENKTIEMVDLPGIYSLSAASLDEEVARDYILSGEADLIINIIDASNLERNLYLTVQLLEMQVPMVLAVNMMDTAKKRRIEIDIPMLSRRIGCPVVPLVASREKGVKELRSKIKRCAQAKSVSELQVVYPSKIQEAIDALVPLVQEAVLYKKMNPRYAAMKLLEGDEWISSFVSTVALKARDDHQQRIEDKLDDEADILMADSRYGLISWLTKKAVKKGNRVGKTVSDKIDSIVLNRVLGIPIFLIAMYLMFMLTINIGSAFIDFFDIFAGTHLCGRLWGAAGRHGITRMDDSDSCRRNRRRYPDHRHIYSAYRLYVFMPLFSGRLRLHGPGRLCYGSFYADNRTAWQIFCTHAGGIRLQRTGHHGHPHP